MITFNIGQTIYIYNFQKNACSSILFNNVLSNLMNYYTMEQRLIKMNALMKVGKKFKMEMSLPIIF